jgi:hypothetical protein
MPACNNKLIHPFFAIKECYVAFETIVSDSYSESQYIIVPCPESGNKDKFNTYKIILDQGLIYCIGRELKLKHSRQQIIDNMPDFSENKKKLSSYKYHEGRFK